MPPRLLGESLVWIPHAVVFDLDGVLVDTERSWTVAEAEVFARRGRSYGPAEKALLIGRDLRAVSLHLADLFDEVDGEAAIADELISLALEEIGTGVRRMPGAVDIRESVVRRAPVALASNSPRVLVSAALEKAGLSEWFPSRLCADDVSAGKPHPEIYLAACHALGMEPDMCLAFKDSSAGCRSAKDAGLYCVGVTADSQTELNADLRVSSLRAEELCDWIAEW